MKLKELILEHAEAVFIEPYRMLRDKPQPFYIRYGLLFFLGAVWGIPIAMVIEWIFSAFGYFSPK